MILGKNLSGHEEEGESGTPGGGGEVGCLHIAEITQMEEGSEVRGLEGMEDTAKYLRARSAFSYLGGLEMLEDVLSEGRHGSVGISLLLVHLCGGGDGWGHSRIQVGPIAKGQNGIFYVWERGGQKCCQGNVSKAKHTHPFSNLL